MVALWWFYGGCSSDLMIMVFIFFKILNEVYKTSIRSLTHRTPKNKKITIKIVIII